MVGGEDGLGVVAGIAVDVGDGFMKPRHHLDADDGRVLLTPVTCTVTVNTGRVAGFSQIYVGAGVVSFDGTATVTDKRTTGATDPCCGLLCIGVDTYEVHGSKA